MDTLNIEGWCKPSEDQKSIPIGNIRFTVSEEDHLRLEQAEIKLQETEQPEIFLDADMEKLELKIDDTCGPLSDCQFRVYLGSNNHRGQFHLVGHRASDGSLVYSNAVMIDSLVD